jgi:hypothetical protein
LKTQNRFARPAAYVPPVRSPFQDYVATQRRMVWVERLGKFAVGLVVLLAALGHFGK